MNGVVVLDSNVLISSIFWDKGNSHKIVELIIEQRVINFTSSKILDEIDKVLRVKFQQPEEMIERQIELIKNYSQLIEPKLKLKEVKDDPKDDKILECAVECGADYIVTGDIRHLLKMKEFRGIKIISPTEFLGLINKN